MKLIRSLLLASLLNGPVVLADTSADPVAPATQASESEKSATAEAPATTETEKHKQQQKSDDGKDAAVVLTEHEITIGGQLVKYQATAGTYPLKGEDGKTKADLFFVSYEKLPRPTTVDEAAARPITFVFNGGPGAASVWLHLGTAGPQRVQLSDLGEAMPPPYRVVPNEFSWLDATDLVFIDPIGTGYSRATAGENPRQFYGVTEDVQWVSEFIRLYTTRNLRWPSPKFLAGESYGTTRAAALSEHLLEEQGLALNGVVLISTVLDFGTIRSASNNDLPYVLFLPTLTATAHYHKKLPEELQADLSKALKEAEAFALGEYASALARGSSLPAEERAGIAKKVARYTGLPEKTVLQADLRISSELFRKALLLDEQKVLGRFDARLAGFDPDPLDRNPDHDPSFNAFFAAYAGAFNDYVRRTLNYETDRQYDVLTGRVQPWNYGRGGDGWLNVADDLDRAMRKNPHMRLMVCSGLYDQATPYLAADYTLNHMQLNAELRKNVSTKYYPGGHMLYHEAGALKQLKADIAAFIAAAETPDSK